MESLRELFEAREEVQRLRHMYYMKKHELEDARKNLAEVSNELKKLRRALPPLPDPDRLYVNTIDRCHEFHACTKKMTQLEERIRALARSTEDLDVRLHELSLLEVTADKLRLEFLFVRCQLRTLFAAPELLFATGKISENVWDAWMSNPQFNDDGKPLLMKPNVIETAIADQLQVLDSHRSTLTELRTALASEEHLRDEAFQQQIAAQMANLQQVLNQLLHMMEEQRAQQPPDQQEQRNNNAPAPEDIPMEDHEGDVINNNAEFLEEVDEAGGEQNEEVEQANDQEEDVELEAEPERQVNNEERRNQILAELAQLQQARNNLEHIIQDLRSQRQCRPRRFGRGSIRQREDRFMRCAFCREVGDHYSDSCYRVRSARQRRNVIEDAEKCALCLEPCPGGADCPKYNSRCFHCRSREHHSALCELPERSEEISENLMNARRSLTSTVDRIRALQEDLRHLDD